MEAKESADSTSPLDVNQKAMDAIVEVLESRLEAALFKGYYGTITVEIKVQDGVIRCFVDREERKRNTA